MSQFFSFDDLSEYEVRAMKTFLEYMNKGHDTERIKIDQLAKYPVDHDIDPSGFLYQMKFIAVGSTYKGFFETQYAILRESQYSTFDPQVIPGRRDRMPSLEGSKIETIVPPIKPEKTDRASDEIAETILRKQPPVEINELPKLRLM